MDAATDSKVEVKGSMKCTESEWDAIFNNNEEEINDRENNKNM